MLKNCNLSLTLEIEQIMFYERNAFQYTCVKTIT